ncbi:hypothetical protein PR048_025554, partial [Dryococelus australis]
MHHSGRAGTHGEEHIASTNGANPAKETFTLPTDKPETTSPDRDDTDNDIIAVLPQPTPARRGEIPFA